ncbi:hypothetical protein CDD83_2823 [Cordyceps sp. RAO-2017]|nr:hypothetical protein CDD83_2823 [Cordyceps sp. RAO-2017]
MQQEGLKKEVFIKRQVLKRGTNEDYSTTQDVHRSRTSVKFDSTTKGWTGGVHMGVLKALTISGSGSYSSHTTEGSQEITTEATTFHCPPRMKCWSEIWIPYLKLTGTCTIEASSICGMFKGNPCSYKMVWNSFKTPHGLRRIKVREYSGMPFVDYGHCYIDTWHQQVCPPNNAKGHKLDKNCRAVYAVMEGEQPYSEEHWFTSPIDPPPTITGYLAGEYLLGSKDQTYDPHRSSNRYRNGNDWTTYPGYPTLNISGWKHEKPKIIGVASVPGGGACYHLDTQEFFCPGEQGEAKYYTDRKRYYAKPKGAPEPTPEDIARFMKTGSSN